MNYFFSCRAKTHTDSDEYSIVAFCKNATIINTKLSNQTALILRISVLHPHIYVMIKYFIIYAKVFKVGAS